MKNIQSVQHLQTLNNMKNTQNNTLQPRQYATTLPKTSSYLPNNQPPSTNFVLQNQQNIYQGNRAYNNNTQTNGPHQTPYLPPSSQPHFIFNCQQPSYQLSSQSKDRLHPSNNFENNSARNTGITTNTTHSYSSNKPTTNSIKPDFLKQID
jgi:hypothetical protein